MLPFEKYRSEWPNYGKPVLGTAIEAFMYKIWNFYDQMSAWEGCVHMAQEGNTYDTWQTIHDYISPLAFLS